MAPGFSDLSITIACLPCALAEKGESKEKAIARIVSERVLVIMGDLHLKPEKR